MAPAARLFAKLGYPTMDDKGLRQYLLILYRKLYTIEGQRAAEAKRAAVASAAAAAKAGAAGAPGAGATEGPTLDGRIARQNGNGNGNGKSGTHGIAGLSSSDDDEQTSDQEDEAYCQRKRNQNRLSAGSAAFSSQMQQHQFQMQARNGNGNNQFQFLNKHQHYNPVPPASQGALRMNSQQELMLFMRWLNNTHDAMSKIQQAKDGVAANAAAASATAATASTGKRMCEHSSFLLQRAVYTCLSIKTSCFVEVLLNFLTLLSIVHRRCFFHTGNQQAAHRVPKFDVAQRDRQVLMERISTLLKDVLSHRAPKDIVESVRLCEYELLFHADDAAAYADQTTLPARVVLMVNAHPQWGIPRLQVGAQGKLVQAESSSGGAAVVDLTADDADTSNNPAAAATAASAAVSAVDPTQWRSSITEEIRQDMIFRVEKMLRLVSKQLSIHTVGELNHKIQQYEMGLVISANSLEEYMDKETLPRRLAGLVTDFTEYKKTLTAKDLLG